MSVNPCRCQKKVVSLQRNLNNDTIMKKQYIIPTTEQQEMLGGICMQSGGMIGEVDNTNRIPDEVIVDAPGRGGMPRLL